LPLQQNLHKNHSNEEERVNLVYAVNKCEKWRRFKNRDASWNVDNALS
jgi:hypothetical protein